MLRDAISPWFPFPFNGVASRRHNLLRDHGLLFHHLIPRTPSTFNYGSTDFILLRHLSCLLTPSERHLRVYKSHSAGGIKNVDVATLGNLCVDVVMNVPELPRSSYNERKAYMELLSASPPHMKYWEAGGNCNMAIASARLGLNCMAIGHVGIDVYGQFLKKVLKDEGISMIGMSVDTDDIDDYAVTYETLLCWVLVDPLQRHGFCSRADFSDEPAFSWLSKLSEDVKMAIKRSKVIFCNGYAFDELHPGLIMSTLKYAYSVGTSIFFDPGPRGRSLLTGTPEEQQALHYMLAMTDVLLLTFEEAEALTGIGNPILAGQELLRRGLHTKWVIVKLGSKGSILITKSSVACAPAFKVNVIDTVGCGDSFVAAIAFGFIRHLSLVSTLAAANAVGAATAMGCGAGRNVARLESVLQLLRTSNLNDDEEFWNEMVNENFETVKIIFLSKTMSGNNRVSLKDVVFDLLEKLESENVESIYT